MPNRRLISPFASWASMAAILALCLWGLMTPWGLGLDFANFYDIGHKVRLGEYATLYERMAQIGGEKPLGNMKYMSPPITGWFFTPLSLMTPHVATFWLKLAGVLSALGGLVLLYRQVRPLADRPEEFFALFWIAAALWQPLWTFMRVGGQTTPIIFLLLVIGHATYLRRQMAATALIFSFIVLLKPVFAPIAILLFVTSGNSFRMTAICTAAASIVLSLWIFGWGPHGDFLRALGAQGDRLLEPWMNSSPVSWIVPLLIGVDDYGTGAVLAAPAAILISILRFALAAVAIAVMVGHLRSPLPDRARLHLIYATGLLLVIVLSPVIWAHYLMILFPLIAVLIACRSLMPGWGRVLLAAMLILGVFQSFIIMRQLQIRLGFDNAGEVVVFSLLKSLPAILLLCTWVFGRRAIRGMLAQPAWNAVAPGARPAVIPPPGGSTSWG